jgi:Transcriptional regulator containing PAS, AAA-type ATPase, and DNA-binding domains
LRQERLSGVAFDPEVWDFLLQYEWKGNIRELRNCVEYMANISDGHITYQHLPDYIYNDAPEKETTAHPPTELSAWENGIDPADQSDVADILGVLSKKPVGRRALLQTLTEEGVDMSEYRLRALLGQLSRSRHIFVGRGRAGCSLSSAGLNLLQRLRKSGF